MLIVVRMDSDEQQLKVGKSANNDEKRDDKGSDLLTSVSGYQANAEDER